MMTFTPGVAVSNAFLYASNSSFGKDVTTTTSLAAHAGVTADTRSATRRRAARRRGITRRPLLGDDDGERISRLDRLAGGDVQRFERAADGGHDGELHLQGLHHEDAIALRDGLAHLRVDPENLSWRRRFDDLFSHSVVSITRGPASQKRV